MVQNSQEKLRFDIYYNCLLLLVLLKVTVPFFHLMNYLIQQIFFLTFLSNQEVVTVQGVGF